MHLSIIIPCYNEGDNLIPLIDQCEKLVNGNPGVEVILVNNGSTDNSSQIMESIISRKGNSAIKSHLVEKNKGYGFGILEGLNQAKANVICWTHADLQTDVFDCIKAFELFQAESDPYLMIKGRRYGRSAFDRLFTSLMSFYVLCKLHTVIPDINAQPKLFSKKFYQEIARNAPFDFSLDLYFLIHAKKKGRILEFPVNFSPRTAGEAKGGSGNLKLKFKLTQRTLAFINQFKAK